MPPRRNPRLIRQIGIGGRIQVTNIIASTQLMTTMITRALEKAARGRAPRRFGGSVVTSTTLAKVHQLSNGLVTVTKVEQLEEIADRRRVDGDIRVNLWRNRVREIIPTAVRDRTEIPVPLNELDD
jgi:hypothetical protein